ncbi:hypothetical protein [Amycolatopsis taiwanensis]|uniref:Uncharacterized protein n=1 Tax=Amycolatopsis taiwanensis TaxID=342230 RepID=A0A9W6R0H3_9PSEU|nr:hypothetical protein [Amycolatopsis taiwanensis]GLY67068.1 hypothetical protein Atai01_36870 [Amycolatopsis taiwanensis]
MPELEPSVLPVTVAASHLRACAVELEKAGTAELGEVTAMIHDVVAAQRHLSAALAALAARVEDGRDTTLAAVPSPELVALTEVLQAAASAVGYSADALTESEPFAQSLADFAGTDTRL